MATTVDFLLPDLGEGVHEAEMISWKVKVGDQVDEMQTLAEMETDKALVEVPSPYAGTIVTLHGKEGDILHVGKPLVTYENASQGGTSISGENGIHTHSVAVESGDAAAEQAEPTAHAAEVIEAADQADAGTVVGSMESQPSLSGDGKSGKVMATPAVRRLAKDLGVDISSVRGTGRGGRVTATDVQNATSSAPQSTPSQPAPPLTQPSAAASVTEAATSAPQPTTPLATPVDTAGIAQRVPFRGVRRKIAEALSNSIKTAVHFTVMDSADVTALDKLRRRQAAASGEKLSFLPFVVQAICRGLRQYPQLNANVDDAKSEILIKGVHNIGIAVDTEHGLMVPVISNADRLGVIPLQRAINENASKCRSRTVELDQLKGGTFTVSNVGSYGGAFGTPIINYPEVAILGVGRARERVLARNGGIFVGLEMPMSLACDHRVVDGADAARFLNHILQLLENPEMLLEPVGQ